MEILESNEIMGYWIEEENEKLRAIDDEVKIVKRFEPFGKRRKIAKRQRQTEGSGGALHGWKVRTEHVRTSNECKDAIGFHELPYVFFFLGHYGC